MVVPSRALAGDDAQLSCEYDLMPEEKLYSLTWWKDDSQFLQFKPDGKLKNTVVFKLPGVNVNVSYFSVNEENGREIIWCPYLK